MKFLKPLCTAVALLSVVAGLCAKNKMPVISQATLLKEMTDRTELARFPHPAYKCVQFSSYDRASTSPDDLNWYANVDHSKYLRSEEIDGRTEYVMVDAKGPGAIVRFWMTFGGEENGTLRFYVDGASTPVLQGKAQDILSGDAFSIQPFAASLSPLNVVQRRGHNLYFPIPYASSIKVTYERSNPKPQAVYYNIECREYTEPVTVVSYDGSKSKDVEELEALTAKTLADGFTPSAKSISLPVSASLSPEGNESFAIIGARAIDAISLQLEADDMMQAMRSTVISIEFDGEESVWAPVGDFFGVGYSAVFNKTFFNSCTPEGNMTAWWVMPFARECKITLHNFGKQDVKVTGNINHDKWKWDERSMHFGACWHQLTDYKTGVNNRTTPVDVTFAKLSGKGLYVGDAVAVYNTVGAWWGEGDEKVYVDGESFPSHFGTGSEDYYGYAWCAPPVFTEHPFLAMPIGDGNLGIGRTVNGRYRCLDAIPFTSSIDYRMELYEWQESRINYAPVSFWYMVPGGECHVAHDIEGVRSPVISKREQLLKPVLSSHIEGEDMTVKECTSGEWYIQYVNNGSWYYNTCMFYHKAVKGSKLTLTFESPYEAEVRADAIFGMAKDYATINMYFNGVKVISDCNLKCNQITSRTFPMGIVHLLKGINTVTIEIAEEGESPNHGIVGLDRLAFYPL